MSHDAAEQSLAARIRSLSLAPDLRDVLAELAERTEPEPPAEAAHEGEYQAMLDRAAAPLRGGGQHARRPCHLRVITGGLAAIAAVAGIAWRWAWKSGAHQAVATVVTAAMVGAAAAPVAVSVMPYSTPTAPAVNARHIRPHHQDGPAPALWPVATAPHKRRRRVHHHDYDAPAASTPSPAPSASATGSGFPTPLPTATVTPDPSPTPTVGGGGDLIRLPGVPVVVQQGALRGLPWPNMLHHVSRGRYAAPG